MGKLFRCTKLSLIVLVVDAKSVAKKYGDPIFTTFTNVLMFIVQIVFRS